MAVYGDEDARHYAALGIDPQRLVVTGPPEFDHLAAARDGAEATGTGVTIFGQAHTWVGPRSTLGYEPDAWCDELTRLYRALSARFPGAPVRIKPHPAESAHGVAHLYERAVPEELQGIVQVLTDADDNARLILDSALVISFSSSVWLEARFLGRTAAYFSLRSRSGRAAAEIDALGGLWIPGRGLDLTERLVPHLDRLAQRTREPALPDDSVLRRYVGPPDGRAAVRVADLAEQMLADGPPDVDLPELTFDSPLERPRLLRPQVSYAHYVHLQALADEVTAAGVEHPQVLELAPEGSDLVAQMPLAFHTRRDSMLADGQTDAVEPGSYDVVVAPDLWSRGLPAAPGAELTAMIAAARRRVVFSVAVSAIDELHDTAANLLAGGPLDDAPPACRPDLEKLAMTFRALGLRVQKRPVHNGASYCQSLLMENLGLEPESLYALRRSLQASGYPHERHEGGVRLVYVLEK